MLKKLDLSWCGGFGEVSPTEFKKSVDKPRIGFVIAFLFALLTFSVNLFRQVSYTTRRQSQSFAT